MMPLSVNRISGLSLWVPSHRLFCFFTGVQIFILLYNLISEVASPDFTTHSVMIQIYKTGSKSWAAQNHPNFCATYTTFWLDCKYLRNTTRSCEAENGVIC